MQTMSYTDYVLLSLAVQKMVGAEQRIPGVDEWLHSSSLSRVTNSWSYIRYDWSPLLNEGVLLGQVPNPRTCEVPRPSLDGPH